MEEWNILTAAMFFYYADGVKEKNANEEHFPTFQAPKILFLGNKWSRDLGGAKGGWPIRARVTSRVTKTDGWEELAEWPARHRPRARAPPALTAGSGSWGASPPQTAAQSRPHRRPPTAVSHQNKPDHPKTKQNPLGASPAVPVTSRLPTRLRARLGHLAPRAGAPKRGRGSGARKHQDGNVKSLTNSS